LTVVAGPNGSGKSTYTRALDFEGRENLLDPDAVSRRLSPANPRTAAIASAREILERMQYCLDRRTSFAIETTLASRKTLQTMQKAKLNGFAVELIYICLDTPERCVFRVRERVLQGGHHVPDTDVRRRYQRSLANLPEALRIADRAILFDNSEGAHQKMLEVRQGRIVWSATKVLHWADSVRAALGS
jgi:predicted ABC-type ATPase